MAIDLQLDTTQYDLARKRAAQNTSSAVQGQQDALKRRFAALGSINSGAAIKQSQLAEEQGQKALGDQNQAIDAAQAQENQRINEIKQGQEFSRSERLGGQEFAGSQAELQRKFATGERVSSQDFASIQADLQRKFATGERLSSQDFANLQRIESEKFTGGENKANRELQNQQFLMDQNFKIKIADAQQNQFDQQMSLANKQFMEDQKTTEFNKKIAQQTADQNGGGGIFSQIQGAWQSYYPEGAYKNAYDKGANYFSSRV